MMWFNYIGLTIVVLMMIPNIIYSLKHKFGNSEEITKIVIAIENIGRYGSMIFMVFNIPHTWFPMIIPHSDLVYIFVEATLTGFYIVLFIIFWNRSGLLKALVLSIIPSLIFFSSGVIIFSFPLIISSIIFSCSHIYISVKNANMGLN